jgi:hypothetical protein
VACNLQEEEEEEEAETTFFFKEICRKIGLVYEVLAVPDNP